MAQEKKKRKVKDTGLPFGKRNMQLLIIGLLTLVIGFVLMAQPPVDGFLSLTLAPIVLLIGYLVIIPYAILYNEEKRKND